MQVRVAHLSQVPILRSPPSVIGFQGLMDRVSNLPEKESNNVKENCDLAHQFRFCFS